MFVELRGSSFFRLVVLDSASRSGLGKTSRIGVRYQVWPHQYAKCGAPASPHGRSHSFGTAMPPHRRFMPGGERFAGVVSAVRGRGVAWHERACGKGGREPFPRPGGLRQPIAGTGEREYRVIDSVEGAHRVSLATCCGVSRTPGRFPQGLHGVPDETNGSGRPPAPGGRLPFPGTRARSPSAPCAPGLGARQVSSSSNPVSTPPRPPRWPSADWR